ncbi:MAG: TonB-dependent receptor [Bryobacteraceae bacterium]
MTSRCYLLAVLLAVVAAAVFAQSSEITGQVTDTSDAAIAGAKVATRHVSTGIVRNSVTNQEGYYTFRLLGSGAYEISVESTGFKSMTRSGITLEIGQTARVDFRLEVGEVREKIIVEDTAPLLQTESASISQLVTGSSVLDLPLNGRTFTGLATLVPGAVGGNGTSYADTSSVRINGMRDSGTSYIIDGVSTTNQTFSGTSMAPPPDAIQEFKVHGNSLQAEFGQAGAVIEVQLKSGTNEFHGGAYDFLRNNKLDARNFFSLTKAPLRQNQFGGQLGGPIAKNRTFFFGSYEGTINRGASTRNLTVPTVAMRSGDFSALTKTIQDPLTGIPFTDNKIPTARLSPQTTYFLDFYPSPNNSSGTYAYNASSTSDTHQFDTRIDHHISEHDQLSGTYSFQNRSRYSPGSLPDNGGITADMRFQRIGISEIHTFNPATMNEFRAGFMRSVSYQTQQGLGTNYATLAGIGGLSQTSAEFPGFPGLSISNYAGFSADNWTPIRFRENTYELRDNISWVRSRHTIKAGGYFRRAADDQYNAAYSRGSFGFTGTYAGHSFADFLLGYPYSGTRSFPRNLFGFSQHNEGAYVQDDWKITPRITVNVGVRYELNHPSNMLHNQGATMDFANRRIIASSGDGGEINLTSQQVAKFAYPLFSDIIVSAKDAGLPSSLRHLDANNFGPRLGLAIQLPRNVVLRTGYGIMYALEQGNQVVSTQMINLPFIADETATYNTSGVPTKDMTNLFQDVGSATYKVGSVTFYDMNPHRRDLYLQQWNLALQTSIARVVSVEAAYVGSKGTRLSFSAPQNVPVPGAGTIQTRREWTRFTEGTYLDDSGNSSYHSLQMKAEVRNRRGFSMLTSYTFGKAISSQSGDNQASGAQDARNIAAEKSRDSWDRRHVFVFSSTYALPFFKNRRDWVGYVIGGWNVSNIISLYSGAPFTPSISTDRANTGRSYRPDRIGSGKLDNPTIVKWFDASAFALPALYTYGNSGKYILDSPGTRNWNIGLLKDVPVRPLGERAFVQFRAEFFNFTNTPAFGGPTTSIQSSSVGKITSAGSPRQAQMALKLSF